MTAHKMLSCLYRGMILSACLCRPEYWFWDSITLWQTLFLVVAQVFTTAKGNVIQLISMLVILVVGHAAVLHLRPLGAPQSQAAQVRTYGDLLGLATVLL